MKAISIWQPWASAIILGYKTIETRGWSTRHRGPLLIHAAKHFPKVARDFAAEELACGRGIERVPLGALIGIADLVAVEDSDNLIFEVSAIERRYGDYTSGRYGWRLENIRGFRDPIGYRGAQGLFTVPDEIVANALLPTCEMCGEQYMPLASGNRLKGLCKSCSGGLGGGKHSAKIVLQEASRMKVDKAHPVGKAVALG